MKIVNKKKDIRDYISNHPYPHLLHVAHGCNCFHTMGSGVARVLNEMTNGELLKVDKQSPYGDINKLGETSFFTSEENVVFHNCYTQHGTKAWDGGVFVHWSSVFIALSAIIRSMEAGEELVIPKIGTGLAGGCVSDFNNILERLKLMFGGKDITLVVLSV